jgi:hypothetical protein
MDQRTKEERPEERAELMIPVPLTLLSRICQAFLEMADQGARTQDQRLMVDLEQAVADYDQRRP